MKATITVEVPDAFLEERVREFKADTSFSKEARDESSPDSYFREMVEGVARDELPIAFYSWPAEFEVEFETSAG